MQDNKKINFTSGNTRHCIGQTEEYAGNSGLVQAGGQCVIKLLCILFTFVRGDSDELLNPAKKNTAAIPDALDVIVPILGGSVDSWRVHSGVDKAYHG